ncbi:MAG: tRNA (adenosine(37)-N6)-dimethylallyltransferase MiaA [Gammaproteobacteria bacterium]
MNTHAEKQVIFLMGPTGAGKTALALKMADERPVALINVDSAQVYRGLDIGSAKLSKSMLARYPHALIDVCDPATPYNVADFCRDAMMAIEEAFAQGKTPLLVGGTMMYFRALMQGLSALPQASPEVRAAILMQAQEKGWPAMHALLAQVDPAIAARLKPNDAQRISRALEVYEMTGRPLSDWQAEPTVAFPYPIEAIGLMPEDRAALHAALEKRFDAMLAEGFLEEVEGLRAREDLHADLPAIKSVGYQQAWAYLNGETDFDTFRALSIIATRQLAKRQMTWLRSWPGLNGHTP